MDRERCPRSRGAPRTPPRRRSPAAASRAPVRRVGRSRGRGTRAGARRPKAASRAPSRGRPGRRRSSAALRTRAAGRARRSASCRSERSGNRAAGGRCANVGTDAGSSPALSIAPVRDGSRPVISAPRDGTHRGEAQRARSNTVPPRASPVRCGAIVAGSPYAGNASAASWSAITSRMLGRHGEPIG